MYHLVTQLVTPSLELVQIHNSHLLWVIPDGESTGVSYVRNMGNFNLFKTHVLTFFHHVEQCCYPSFLSAPHIPAMTSHVAYVIYATITLITTQGLCNIIFFLCLSLVLCIWDRLFL